MPRVGVLLHAVVLVFVAIPQVSAAPSQQSTKELLTVLELAEDDRIDDFSPRNSTLITFSDDYKHVAYLSNSKRVVYRDGKRIKEYSHPFVVENLRFSPHGGVLVQFLQKLISGQKQKEVIVINDQQGQEYDVVTSPLFSADDQNFAYMAGKVGEQPQRYIVNGLSQAPLNFGIVGSIFRFSPSSKHYAYYRKLENGRFAVVFDGKELSPYDAVETPLFIHGDILAYPAKRGSEWFVVIEGQEAQKHYSGRIERLSTNQDGTHLAYVVDRSHDGKSETMIIVDGKEYGPYGSIQNANPYDRKYFSVVFSPDGTHFAFVEESRVLRDRTGYIEYSVIIDGKERSEAYADVNFLRFLADGRIVYKARKSGWRTVLVVGKDQKMLGDSHSDNPVVMNNASTAFAYVIGHPTRGRARIGFDKSDGSIVRSRSYYFPREPAVSPDGKSFAFVAEKKGERIRMPIDEIKMREEDIANLQYSSDGKFATIDKRGKKILVLNDKIIAEFDAIWDPVFSSDSSTVTYAARKGKEIWRITEIVQ